MSSEVLQNNESFMSVVIPVYHDWGRLVLCIAALKNQSLSTNDFEVLIVNNDPNDPVPSTLSLPDNFKIIAESRPGSYSARNKGIKEAAGKIVAFADSDCIPDRHWLKNALTYFNTPSSNALIAGDVKLFSSSGSVNIFDKYEFVFGFPIKRYVENSGFGVTANLIVSKTSIDAIGLFNEDLYSGGDVDFCKRHLKAGGRIIYGGDVIVSHPTRGSFQALLKKVRRVSGNGVAFKKNFKTFLVAVARLRPPIEDLKYIKSAKELKKGDKILVFFLRYAFRIYSAYITVITLLGAKTVR